MPACSLILPSLSPRRHSIARQVTPKVISRSVRRFPVSSARAMLIPVAYVGPSGKGSEFPLLTLQEQKHLRLVVSVPEAFTSYFKRGDTIDFSVKARSNESFKATINRHAGALDSRLRSERVEMDVANDDKKLLPGMIAEVKLAMKGTDSTYVVPRTAVVNAAEGVFVIRVQQDTAVWIPVRTGRAIENRVEVFGELKKGDVLVKSANEEIRKGSREGE